MSLCCCFFLSKRSNAVYHCEPYCYHKYDELKYFRNTTSNIGSLISLCLNIRSQLGNYEWQIANSIL